MPSLAQPSLTKLNLANLMEVHHEQPWILINHGQEKINLLKLFMVRSNTMDINQGQLLKLISVRNNSVELITLLKFLLSINKKIPATVKTKNNNISNKSFSIEIEAPKKANGMDPARYGTSNLRFMLPDLRQLIEFPDTTIILQNKANMGMMQQGKSQINISAR